MKHKLILIRFLYVLSTGIMAIWLHVMGWLCQLDKWSLGHSSSNSNNNIYSRDRERAVVPREPCKYLWQWRGRWCSGGGVASAERTMPVVIDRSTRIDGHNKKIANPSRFFYLRSEAADRFYATKLNDWYTTRHKMYGNLKVEGWKMGR